MRFLLVGISLLIVNYYVFLIFGQISLNEKEQPHGFVLSLPLRSCCSKHILHDSDALIYCANKSAYLHETQVFSHIRSSFIGPSLSIGIVTYATFDIWNYAAYAVAVNAAFAEFNGNYLFKLLDPNTTSGNFDYYDSRWNKVSILRDAIHPDHG
eukprot:gene31787-41255_t